jgi:hypothetical protein
MIDHRIIFFLRYIHVVKSDERMREAKSSTTILRFSLRLSGFSSMITSWSIVENCFPVLDEPSVKGCSSSSTAIKLLVIDDEAAESPPMSL